MPAWGRQMDLWESYVSLVYKAISRTARAVTKRNFELKNRKRNKDRKKGEMSLVVETVPQHKSATALALQSPPGSQG